jgi:hypothetical protein
VFSSPGLLAGRSRYGYALASIGVVSTVALSAPLVLPAGAGAVVVPQELSHVCVNNANGLLRHASTLSCKRNETLTMISASAPMLACASSIDNRVRRVSAFTSCVPGDVQLTLPPSSGPVHFCAKKNDALRHVSDPAQCTGKELALVVSVSNAAPVVTTTAGALAYTGAIRRRRWTRR